MAGGTRADILSDADYERLMALLAGTAKGRSFLAEYATQARAEDTRALLTALAAIQSSLAVVREQLRPAAVAGELERIAATLGEDSDGGSAGRARAELTALADALARGAPPDPHQD